MQLGWTTLTGNLAMSALMALVLWIAGRLPAVRYRPRLRYALWLLVLLKLIPLPGLAFPIGLTPEPPPVFGPDAVSATDVPTPEQLVIEQTRPFERVNSADASTTPHTNARAHARMREWPDSWSILLCLTMAMTAGLIWKSLSQMRQVSRLIDCAGHADARITRLSIESARLMSFQGVPVIRLVDARITPLLWSQRGSPTIVLPMGLIERLDDDQIRCIICHEIAHYLRHDAWINLFAYLAASAYWWNPFAWWARRELLSAQEECCDALVISRPGLGRRKYAEALIETIEFISDERPLSPVLASGFGSKSIARRRFDMIAESRLNRRVLGLVFPLVIALGIAFVSSPVRSQAEKEGSPESTPVGTDREELSFDVDKLTDIERFLLLEALDGNSSPGSTLDGSANAAPTERRTSLNFNKAAEVTVDPKKHCLYVGIPPYEGCENGTLRIDLEKGVTYTVRCSGEAFMSTETGGFADPYPGIVFAFQTDQQDCHEICNTILKPGDTITFTTPTCIGADEDVFAIAFFMQAWKHAYWPAQRGSYTLSFTRTAGNPTVPFGFKHLDLEYEGIGYGGASPWKPRTPEAPAGSP